MEHWAQKCDGAGVDPAEHAAVCRERDELKAAYEGAQLAMKALNENLVQVTAEREYLVGVIRASVEGCDFCAHAAGIDGCTFDGLCDECPNESCKCKACFAGSRFEFAGVPEGGAG